ncbi:MAG TPA: hypothetical protein VNK95_11650, partial [Caldilineaceae bacterium]|nr:hypothetical protein [Caldilineaceae bacterium]
MEPTATDLTSHSTPAAQVDDARSAGPALAERAVTLAAELLAAAKAKQTPAEQAQAAKLARMVADPRGKALVIALTDQLFRSRSPARTADQLKYLLERYGGSAYFTLWEQLGLRLGAWVGQALPWLV